MNPTRGKRFRLMDSISYLPDHLVDRILSFLPVRDIIATSLLSRRWRNRWKSIPIVNFSEEFQDCLQPSAFVSQFLKHYDGLTMIQSFTVSLGSEDSRGDFWDSCLQFAAKHKVEELDLSIRDRFGMSYKYKLTELYDFPLSLAKCQHLKTLRMAGGGLKLPSFQFRNLKEIVFISMELTDVDTSGCPLLEKLVISMCNSKGSLNIYAPNRGLRDLDISDSQDVCTEDTSLMIYAPHLLSVRFIGFLRRRYHLKNLYSVINASFCFSERVDRSSFYSNDMEDALRLMELIRTFSYVNNMELCQWCMQVLSYRDAKGLETPRFNTKSLVLTTNMHPVELRGMACILRNCHDLERVVINIRDRGYFTRIWNICPHYDEWSDENTILELLRLALSSQLHLKTVIINDLLAISSQSLRYSRYETLNINKVIRYAEEEIELVKLLLQSCKVLDKMIVSTTERLIGNIRPPEIWKCYRRPLLISRLTKKLLASGKASVDGKVLIS